MAIHFFSQSTPFKLDSQDRFVSWVESGLETGGLETGELNFIFCSDNYLLEINRRHLDHDFFTDIITFDYSLDQKISGDIFISVERVNENAEELNIPFRDELHRVMAHGILHLMGYNDNTPEEQAEMRKKEDFWLSLRPF